MPDSSIVVFADGVNQHFYRILEMQGEKLKTYACAEGNKLNKLLKADIILIDCGYRANLGLELLKEMKKAHPQTPVVFLTDLSSEDTAISAFRSGAREYLKKPVNPVILRSIVKNLLDTKRKSLEKRRSLNLSLNTSSNLFSYLKDEKLPFRILESLLFIDDNLTEEITLASLAKSAHMNKYYFSRYFKAYTGSSPMKYVNKLRLKRARELLSRIDLRVTEVAHLLGFKDVSSFIRNFKREYGLTPRDYRKESKPRN